MRHGAAFMPIANLDGLRALAVGAVLALHGWHQRVPGGMVGVDLFFTLSGFLITTLLIREHRATGGISLRKFYIRRFLRLYPALVAAILLTAAAWPFLKLSPEASLLTTIFAPLFYLSNFVPQYYFVLGPLGICWSLAVEEHFYLVWPAVALLFLKAGRFRGMMLFCFAVAAGSLALRLYLYQRETWLSTFDLYAITPCRLDGIMLGCLAGIAFELFPEMVRKYFASRGLLVGAIAAFFACCICFDARVPYQSFAPSISITAISLIIVLAAASSPPTWLLSNPFATWIGKRSYGIYLYHFTIFQLSDALIQTESGIGQTVVAWSRVAVTLIVAGLSYRFLETPFLKLKSRFEAVKTESRVEAVRVRKPQFADSAILRATSSAIRR